MKSASPLESRHPNPALLRPRRPDSACAFWLQQPPQTDPGGAIPIAPYRGRGVWGGAPQSAASTAACVGSLRTARISQLHETTAAHLTAATAALLVVSRACGCGGSIGHEPPQNRRMRFNGLSQVVSCLTLEKSTFASVSLQKMISSVYSPVGSGHRSSASPGSTELSQAASLVRSSPFLP
jgi:hypothetical protein